MLFAAFLCGREEADFFFLLLLPVAGGGEGDRDNEVAITSFSGLYRGQNL